MSKMSASIFVYFGSIYSKASSEAHVWIIQCGHFVAPLFICIFAMFYFVILGVLCILWYNSVVVE